MQSQDDAQWFNQWLCQFLQRTGSQSNINYFRLQNGDWQAIVEVEVFSRDTATHKANPEGVVWDATGQAQNKKGARQAALATLFKKLEDDVQRRSVRDDTRMVEPYIEVVQAWFKNDYGEADLYFGKEHGERLANMSGVVAVDTEGHIVGECKQGEGVHWIQFCDEQQVVILPYSPCEDAITAFLKRTDIKKVFCDFGSDARVLPTIEGPVFDVQMIFMGVFASEYPPGKTVSLERMVERFDSNHENRLQSKLGAGFYEHFTKETLSNEHIEYMTADAQATLLVFSSV